MRILEFLSMKSFFTSLKNCFSSLKNDEEKYAIIHQKYAHIINSKNIGADYISLTPLDDFIIGMAQAYTAYETETNLPEYPSTALFLSDADAIRKDWACVGQDMWHALITLHPESAAKHAQQRQRDSSAVS